MTAEPEVSAAGSRRNAMGQHGATLLFVLMLVTLGGIIMVALAAYASTSSKVTNNYNRIRADRYGADGAVKAAINYIKDQPNLAVDPDYQPDSNDKCRFEAQGVTVSCDTPKGSGSGVPPEQGDLPPETVLLLGARHNEPGPYSYSNCDSVWDSISNFFTGFTNGAAEDSFLAQKSKRSSGWMNLGSCTDRARGNGPVKIQGNMVVAGIARANSGIMVQASGPNATDGTIRARRGCVNITCQPWEANRSAPGKPWDSTPSDSDPGRKSAPPALTPIDDIRDEFLPIGFKADGSLRSGYSMPERTKAYVYDKTENTTGSATVPKYLKAIDNCGQAPAGVPIIFLPGWYKKSEILSAYTAAENSCFDRTFWFAPDPGPDMEMLTEDDRTGAFYMDFTGKADSDGRACGTMAKPAAGRMTTSVAARWCLGGSGNQSYNTKPRVVVGWPKNWEPFPDAPSGSGNYGVPVPVSLDTAKTVAGNFLSYWTDLDKAKSVDGQYATYAPCKFWIFTCPTLSQRTLRIEDFSPKVTGSPLAAPGAPNGRLRIEARYGLDQGHALGVPYLDVDVLDRDGVAVDCGSYQMVNDSTVAFNGSGPLPADKKYVLTDAQAKTLADKCGSVEKINNLRLSIRVGGNIVNNPLSKIYLDGYRIYYDTYQGAGFPIGEDNAYVSNKRAKSDCDVTKPGAQLIFGGESNVFIADGSLEVCGGPDPDNPAKAQVIGVYGVPALEPLSPSTVRSVGGPDFSITNGSLNDVKVIGEPAGRKSITIRYGGSWSPGKVLEGKIGLDFPVFDPPAGYKIDKIQARVSYNSKNPGSWMSLGTNSQLRANTADGGWNNSGKCWVNTPLTGDMTQFANSTKSEFNLTLFDSANASTSCLYDSANPANPLHKQREMEWVARGTTAGWGIHYNDDLEGVELDVTIKPSDSTTPRLRPQSGCIVAHPNYTGGEGTPDCALLRAESFDSSDAAEGTPVRGTWVGRLSVKGTVYAPSSAVEIDDNDVAYPLATRGVILRHLRISGAKSRSEYTDPWFGGTVDRSPASRFTVLTACRQTDALKATTPLASRQPCGKNPGDVVLAKAGVRFLAPKIANQQNAANVPVVQWWSDRLTAGEK